MLQAVPGTADGSASNGAAAAADCQVPGAALGRRVINSPADYGIELPAWLHTCIEHVPPGAGESCPTDTEALLAAAFHFAFQLHDGQVRASGEPYICHPVAVADLLRDIGASAGVIAAGFLHDVVEDTEVTPEEIEQHFGPEVRGLVEGVTKLGGIHFTNKTEAQAENLRRMFLAMASDIRVVLVKLADRLHNMRTLAAMPAEKQRRIAQETLDIYAPLAHRLGIQELRQQLEDLSFAALHPKRFAELDHLVATRTPEREIYVAQAVAEVRSRLAELGIEAEVTGRGKHLWSIYEKMVVKGREFDEIFDIVAVRVVVDSIKDCYAALGTIHGRWRPVVGRFKDYIAMPKFNLYQSLHTTVIGPSGRPIEVQIRTAEMHRRAEWGVAAHWAYKSDSPSSDIDWLNRLLDWQAEVSDPAQFMENLKTDLEQDEVFVFTPKGRVITLPVGSTPVDFAYAVHTEVGHSCIGAKVNGRLVSLDSTLASGDSCEIFTSKVETAGPSQDWLGFVVSARARNKIRQWFSRERRLDMIEAGRDELDDELRREGLPLRSPAESTVLDQVLEEAGLADIDSLLAAIGEGHQSARSIAQRVARSTRGEPSEVELDPIRHRLRRDPEVGVHVEGLDDLLVRLSNCCTPVPGDEIIGFVTRGRGVSVHRADCANAVGLAEEHSGRMIDVDWDSETGPAHYRAGVEVVALDRSNLLRDVANALSDHHVNILACETLTGGDRVAKMRFEFELSNPAQLQAVVNRIKAINSVYDAYRTVPGADRT